MTRAYAAPEQLTDGAPLSNATDVWCWAASVLHMFSGIVNWSDGARAPAALERYLRIGPAIPGLALMPVPVVELLRQCFQVNPKDRPGSTAEVVEQMETHYYNATNTAYEKPVESGRYESEDLVDEDVANRKRQMNQAAEQSAPPPHRFSARDRKSSEKRPSRRNDRS
jgi:serine/threonine protein kinase